MIDITRREFIKAAGAAGLVGAFGGWLPAARARTSAQVVVVGGGFGGAAAARYLKLLDPEISVSLIERDRQYVTCPMSNDYIGGNRAFDTLVHDFRALEELGIAVHHDSVVNVDAERRRVVTQTGAEHPYDRLILAPGIDFRWDALEGYDAAAAQVMPHAWKAGPQTQLLRRQLQEMRDGGLFVMVAPDNPFRCPPGPYERASLVANYLATYNRRGKVLILDPKDSFTKQELFMQGWDELYPRGMIEWVPGSQGGTVERIEVNTRTIVTAAGAQQADVANVIPPQQAGMLAHTLGLTDETGFCPVDQRTFESTRVAGIHVIGDSCIAGEMPKSGVSANTQAKVCAHAVLDILAEHEPTLPSLMNACFSLVGPTYGISVAAVYELTDKGITAVEGAGGVSPMDATPAQRRLESVFWRSWYENIVADTFG
ncbi:FAD-dependent oxidoreductase [Ectothiorhodospiraceae bacterium 2226]|nr:FAD-dependent oxidoreductase [Ectothiorhodospiraceae bacterium 2226]